MKRVLIVEFDKIICIRKKTKQLSLKEICIRPLPDVKFKTGLLLQLNWYRAQGYHLVLFSNMEESLVKEVVYVLSAWRYFDEFLFTSELSQQTMQPFSYTIRTICKRYTNCDVYQYSPSKSCDVTCLPYLAK